MHRCPLHGGKLIWLYGSTWYCIPNNYYSVSGHEIEQRELQKGEQDG